ncbi:MAG: S1 RNA-binding domain-containing protein [Clostridiales bacterium]|nr:S1 RNA-binding domain-containing protein [Clostridiales bacterium]
MQTEVGAVLNGKVTGLTDFGAFVELENGETGMVHISEVASVFVKNIRDHLEIGQSVKVKVLGVNDAGKINLSIKKAEEQPKATAAPAPRPVKRPQGGQHRSPAANVWQGQSSQPAGSQSFEEMMARFKQISDEKMTDLKRASETKRGGGGYARKGNKS